MQSPIVSYCILDQEFFESIDRYKPTREYLRVIEEICNDDWTITEGGFWSVCQPFGVGMGVQGWKIHVAGTDQTALELLRRIAPLLVKHKVPFKFCSDPRMIRLSTSKNWSRTSAGKFMTIYPSDVNSFKSLIEQCHCVTRDLAGPYILTDRPYFNSRVIFYRYGGHRSTFHINHRGDRVPMLRSPDNASVPDDRVPFFRLPNWIEDPFSPTDRGGQLKRPTEEVLLKDRRYRVTGAIRYSTSGGIYEGTDLQTNRGVIIREAKPMLGTSFATLGKEARILQMLQHTGLTPCFVDLFQEWENLFLVQERLEAQSLWAYAADFTVGSVPRKTPAELLQIIRETIHNLVAGLEVIHQHGIILRDFTKTNVLFTYPPNERPKFIDFELAYDINSQDPPLRGQTWGYASPQQILNEHPRFEDDYFALGALILDMIAFTASGLFLNRDGILLSFKQTLADLGLPQVLADIVALQTDPNPANRLKPSDIMEKINAASPVTREGVLDSAVRTIVPKRRFSDDETDALKREIARTIAGVESYIIAMADFERNDRLWPASVEVFVTNPISVSFGATGTAYFLLRAKGAIDERIVNWILRRCSRDSCPPGLFTGLAGVACFLLDIGLNHAAAQMLETCDDGYIYERPGLYEGVAGWGLANLYFWHVTGRTEYFDRALSIGKYLVKTAKTERRGAFWHAADRVPLGLGFGASGVALFLTYLGAVSCNGLFHQVARAAVDFDIAHAVFVGDTVQLASYSDASNSSSRSPHTQIGSGGVGVAALRIYRICGDEKYLTFIESCIRTVSSRITNKLWQAWGLAGYGEFLIDAYKLLERSDLLDTALYLAHGLLPYRIARPNGFAFAGAEMFRISCDFALGSAGIGLFLHRLLNPHLDRLFFLDAHLDRNNGADHSADSLHTEMINHSLPSH